MNNQRLMAIAGTVIRGAALPLFGLCAAAALAYTVQWHQTNGPRHHPPPFQVLAIPGAVHVTAGETARYRLLIRRDHFHAPIRLTVARPAGGMRFGPRAAVPTNQITLRRRGRRGTLTVHTAPGDRPGSYSVGISVVGGRYRGYLRLGLLVVRPQPLPVAISGNLGMLWPGTSQPIDLALTNPNAEPIAVRSFTVAVKQVRAPRARGDLPCSNADFSARQFTGAYPLTVPAHATVHLSELGVPRTDEPQVKMLNRPVNQDGCQGAALTLSYYGNATSP